MCVYALDGHIDGCAYLFGELVAGPLLGLLRAVITNRQSLYVGLCAFRVVIPLDAAFQGQVAIAVLDANRDAWVAAQIFLLDAVKAARK